MCVSCLDLTVGALAVEGHVMKQHIENTILDEINPISKELKPVTLSNPTSIFTIAMGVCFWC
ncbi:MAG: hypothetical protein EBX20_09870 [Rhodobacterales bacterium]|nr:hypothetical protein [Rhodobacterales bacterium]